MDIRACHSDRSASHSILGISFPLGHTVKHILWAAVLWLVVRSSFLRLVLFDTISLLVVLRTALVFLEAMGLVWR